MKSPNEPKKNRKVKKKRKSGFIGLVLLFICVYLIVNSIMSIGSSYTSYVVQNGYLEEYVSTDGYIFREQTVIRSSDGGVLECEVGENERVYQGERVASVYQNQIDTVATERLKKVVADIERLERYTQTKDVYANDTVRIEQQIAVEAKNLPKECYQNQWKSISDTKEEINRLIDKKRAANGEKLSDEETLKQLREEKKSIENSNNVQRVYLIAPKPGAFTSRIDGMEDALAIDKVKQLNVDYIKELDKKTVEYQKSVSDGGAACKIVNNSEWYFAANISVDDAKIFSVGESVKLRFFDRTDEAADAVVSSISDAKGGQAVICVKSNGYVDSIYSTSKANVEIIKRKYDGLKIPAQCVRVKDGRTGAYVLRGNIADFVPVELLYNSGEWAIASSVKSENNELKLYDEVVVKAKNLEDGKKLR